MMYIRVLRLHDGRLLLTYTQRSLFPPLGLRAAISWDDGSTWDLEHDVLILEAKTPWGTPSGGGFGNTVQCEVRQKGDRTSLEPRPLQLDAAAVS